MKRTLTFLLSLTLLMTIFAGCAHKQMPNPADPVTLNMWHVYGSQTISPLNTVIDEFNRSLGSEYGISEMQPIKSNLCSQTPNIYINTTNSRNGHEINYNHVTFNGGYEEANKFLEIGDGNTYVITDDTTFLYYTSTSVYQMADEDILTVEDNSYEGLEEAASFTLYIVADEIDDKNTDDSIKTVKTIVVTK